MIVEGDLAADEDVENDAEGPDVDFRTGVRLGIQQLGRCEVEGATEGGEIRARRVEVGKAEVDDLGVARLRDEDVLDLEICAC